MEISPQLLLNSKVEEIYKKAILYSRYRKNYRDSYDFASWIVVKVLEKKYKSLNFRTAYIDYLRHIYGSTQKKSFNQRQIFKQSVELDESKYSYPMEIGEGPLDCSPYVKPKHLEIYKLVMQDEIPAKTVAKMKGVSEGRISQIIRECKEDIKFNIHSSSSISTGSGMQK